MVTRAPNTAEWDQTRSKFCPRGSLVWPSPQCFCAHALTLPYDTTYVPTTTGPLQPTLQQISTQFFWFRPWHRYLCWSHCWPPSPRIACRRYSRLKAYLQSMRRLALGGRDDCTGDDFLVSVVANSLKNRWTIIPDNISLVVYCFTAHRVCVPIILFSG